VLAGFGTYSVRGCTGRQSRREANTIEGASAARRWLGNLLGARTLL